MYTKVANLCVVIILFLVALACDGVSAQAQSISEGGIWRESASKDDRAPWKRITITGVTLKTSPRVGDAVTVIALGSGIAPFELRILKAEHKQNPCDEALPAFWEVELEALTQKQMFDALSPRERNPAYPFDVVVIYPAVKIARQIGNDQLDREMLPKGVPINTVKAAIDLNDDRKPDVVVVEYCCQETQKPGECDYTCGKTFKKVRNLWKLIDSYTPC